MDPYRPEQSAPGQHTPADDPQLEALRAQFPEWDITRVFGGFEAVPQGTTVLRAMFVDGLAEKLRGEP
jgi:hypothetical protein